MVNVTILMIAIIGLLVSSYALYVERKVKREKNAKVICDINDRISCSKVATSKYSKIFGMPNSVYGLLTYITIIVLTLLGMMNFIFYLAILSVIASLILAYILYFKIKSVCLVCNAIYIVNILLLILSYLAL